MCKGNCLASSLSNSHKTVKERITECSCLQSSKLPGVTASIFPNGDAGLHAIFSLCS